MAEPLVEVMGLLGHDKNLPRLEQLLLDLDDKQRKKLSGPVQKHTEATSLNRDGQGARAVAVLGCVTGVRQAASRLQWLSPGREAEDVAVRVVVARRPHWLEDLPAALLSGSEAQPRSFRLVRALVRAGAVHAPDLPEYALLMVRGLTLVGRKPWFEGRSVLERLREDQGLLDDEVWRLFTTEGAGKWLASHDNWMIKPYQQPGGPEIPSQPERTWLHALVALSADGSLDRARLLDATLGAFFRDWTQGDVSWFVKLHDALEPSIDELAGRQATYGRLLAVEPGQPVKLGLGSLRRLLRAGHADLDVLLENAPAALTRPDKGSVVAALQLVADAAASEPRIRVAALEAVSHALTHERVDVQEQALSIISRLSPDDDARDRVVAAHADSLAPTLRSGQPVASAPPAPPKAGPPAREPLTPVADANELGELLAQLVEEAADPADVERLIEGVVRLAQQKPSVGAAALAKRLDHLAATYYPGPWTREEIRADLVALGRSWLTGNHPGRGYAGRQHAIEYRKVGDAVHAYSHQREDWSLAALVTMRLHETAVAVAGGGAPLLSFPTSRDGSIAVDVLNARLRSLGRTKPLRLDAGLALLRVDPGEYDRIELPAGRRATKLLGHSLELLRTSRPAWELVTGDSEALYDSDNYTDVCSWRDPAGPAGAVDDLVAAVLDRRDPLLNLALEAADGEYAGRFDQVTAMWPLMLPHHPDLLAAHAHPRFVRALSKNRSGTEPILEALGRARNGIERPTLSALTLGLAAKNGVERARAVDALIDLSERDRLDGSELGDVMAHLLRRGTIVGSRLPPEIAEAARASAPAANIAIGCLSALLPALPGRRDAHLFVDVAAQLAAEHGRTVRLPDSFAQLATSTKTSVLAKACRRIPQPS